MVGSVLRSDFRVVMTGSLIDVLSNSDCRTALMVLLMRLRSPVRTELPPSLYGICHMSVKIVYIVDHGTNWLMTESVMSIHLILRSICLLFSLVLGIPLKALLRDERMFVHLVLSVPLKAASDFGLTDLASLLKAFHMLVDFASS